MKNKAQLEFAVFCIENIALALGVDAVRVFRALTEESEVLNRYIIPGYEVLHTQSKEYHSVTYRLISEGISDMHCRSDDYLAEELEIEYKEKKNT